MNTSALLRQQIESSLTCRIPSALSPRVRVEPERRACGIAALDELLRGGVPVGRISELVGPECSGRTTAALSLVGGVTRADQVAAWIDVGDCLDPAAAAANGVDLERLLWVRCGGRAAAAGVAVAGHGGVAMLSGMTEAIPGAGGGGSHPRAEGRGMSEAIRAMLQPTGGASQVGLERRERKSIGTPGAVNRPLTFRSEDREEQASSDRRPGRGVAANVAANLSARGAESRHEGGRTGAARRWREESRPAAAATLMPAKRIAGALEEALRATDLLLQGGGFSVIVMDLGNVPAEMAWRVPMATWFRFRAACEQTQASLVLLTQHPCARSSAEVVVRMGAATMQAECRVMSGVVFHAETERQRFEQGDKVVSIRKHPQPERGRGAGWRGAAAWAVGR